MKRFPIVLLVLFLVVPLALTSCGTSPQQEAFNACYAEFPEELELDAEGLISILNDLGSDHWSLPCQRWSTLVDIAAARAKLEALEDHLAEIIKQEETQQRAIESSVATATALAISPTPTITTLVLATSTSTPTDAPNTHRLTEEESEMLRPSETETPVPTFTPQGQ